MSQIRLTREFNFEMAHALHGYDGLCRNIHGHSYRFFVTVKGTPCHDPANPKLGMVMDFGDLKRIINTLIVDRYDHALVLQDVPQNEPLIQQMTQNWQRIQLTPYQPTCEMMLLDFATQIQNQLPENITLVELQLYETAKSKAHWKLEDNI